MPVPALSRPYFTRNNIPFPYNDTQLRIESFYNWALVHCLTGQITTGTAAGTRAAGSLWFARGSSDGVGGFSAITSPGVVGTNLWWNAGVFPAGGLVRGTNSSNHHWILLENADDGTELLVNMSQTAQHMVVSRAPSGTFVGGSAISAPQPSPTTASIQLGQTSHSGTDNGQFNFFADTTTYGWNMFCHFTCSNGSDFHFGMSRQGTACITSWLANWGTSGAQIGDTRNQFLLSTTSAETTTGGGVSGRGGPQAGRISAQAFAANRTPAGDQATQGGISLWWAGGVSAVMQRGLDALGGQYLTVPCEIVTTLPQFAYRGKLTDIYMVGAAPVGSSYPSTVAQEMVVVGDLLVPMNGVVPII